MGRAEEATTRRGSWRDVLAHCQEIVATLDPHPYYVAAYRSAELDYWSRIPGWIQEDVASHSPARCLDIGCAYGTLLLYVQQLSGCAAYGIDFTNTYMSPRLLRAYGMRFAVCNVELDPVPWSARFDVVILTEVLEHFNFHPLPTLRKIRDLLSDDGRLYLSTPDAASWGRKTTYYSDYRAMPEPSDALRARVVDDHVWHFSRDELLALFEQAGLESLRLDFSGRAPYRHFNLTLRRASTPS